MPKQKLMYPALLGSDQFLNCFALGITLDLPSQLTPELNRRREAASAWTNC
jgi:hypothetical protein